MSNPGLASHLNPETMVHHYQISERLHANSACAVYAAQNTQNNQAVALKLPLHEAASDLVRAEIVMHSRFDQSPSIVTIDGTGVWEEKPFLATRLLDGGDLGSQIAEGSGKIETRATTQSLETIIYQLEKEVAQGELVSLDEVEEIVKELSEESLPDLVEDIINADAEDVVEAVAEAAVLHGHWLTPDSDTAKNATIKLLKKEINKPVVEYVPSGDVVFERIHILKGIAGGLAELHQNDIVHRDVKPDNSGIHNGNGVLIDFGVATNDKYSENCSGTVNYVSPDAYEGHITPQVDVFALSVTATEALTGKRPWGTFDSDRVAYYGMQAAPSDISGRNPQIPKDVCSIVMQGLAKNPAERPSASQMQEVFAAHC